MKNVDIMLIQYLTSYTNQAKFLDFKRIGFEDSDWNENTIIKTINKFFTDTDTRKSNDVVPDEVLNIITELSTADSVESINKLVSALRTHGFDFVVVTRFDLPNNDYAELNESAVMFGYLWNYDKSGLKLNCVADGCAHDYEANNYRSASAGDFMSMFQLTDAELGMNGLRSSKVSYDVLKEKNKLDAFDDSAVKVFLNARDWTYCQIYN